ncbi:MAG: hypothetical protein IPF52_10325 [Saprospiraceae bacterium]|nr:hypothetical protein [Saprospiraceae bacterium]
MDLNESFTIGFSLRDVPETERILPVACIVPTDGKGNLLSYVALAKKEILEGYGLKEIPALLEKALQLTEELTPSAIENYFNKNKKVKNSFQKLFLEKELKNLVSGYINRRMHEFLKLCFENNFPLAWSLERKKRFEESRMAILPFEADSVMYFDKSVKGIIYTLKLLLGDEVYSPKDLNLRILNESPAWVSSGQKIFFINHLHGSRLKPFLTKETVFVPDDKTREFFEKFVLGNLHQSRIETSGFDIFTDNSIKNVTFGIRDSFIEKRLVADVIFAYGHTVFSHWDKTKYRNKLHFSDNGEVVVYNTKRDEENEKKYIDQLLQCGFTLNEYGYFCYDNSYFGSVFHLIANKKNLIGFDFSSLSIEDKKICLSEAQLIVSSTAVNDWFDVHGYLKAGEFTIALGHLLTNVKNKDPYFRLPDGTYYIIPDEMMAKLSDLVLFGKDHGNTLKIHKSQRALIEVLQKENEHDISVGEPLAEVQYIPSGNVKAELRPYQTLGVKWMLTHRENRLGCLLADDMGLGKTLQVISLLVHVKETFKNENISGGLPGKQLDLFAADERMYKPVRALVVLPSSLVFNWQSELYKFAPFLHTVVYTGQGRKAVRVTLHTFDVILTTYKTAVLDIDFLKKIHFEYIILDESQYIKNKDSLTFKALYSLSAQHKISMSGTPVENNIKELWAQMHFINPDVLGTFSFFEKHFIHPVQKENDEAKKRTLKEMVAPYLLRRTKQQVAPELPEIMRQVHYSEMEEEQAKMFEKEKSAIRNQILDKDGRIQVSRTQILVSLLRLRQIAIHPILADASYQKGSGKMEDIKNQLKTVCDAGHKVLVFSAFTTVIRLLQTWLEEENMRHETLTGESSSEQRRIGVTSFQNDNNVKVFLISLKAGGVGLNLTAADYVFILDPWWNPFVELQAESRAHRIGQKKQVFVKKFISRNSIEEKILELQEKKLLLSDNLITESAESPEFSPEVLRDLLS